MSAYCSCPQGKNGANCSETTVVTFNNSSVFLHENFELSKKAMLNLLHFDYSIELSFRTTLNHVTLAIGEDISGQNEYFIGLQNGKLIINIHNLIKIDFLKQKALNDANWYKVILSNSTNADFVVEVFNYL